MNAKTLSVFALGCWIVCVNGEQLSPTEHVAKQLAKERVFQKVLKEYFESENAAVNILKRHIEEADLFSKAAPEEILRDPVVAYKLMWRQRYAKEFIVNKFKVNELHSDLLNAELMGVPRLEELDAVALSLTKLLEFYKCRPKDLTDHPKRIFLNPDQAYHFSEVAYTHRRYQYAVLWGFDSLFEILENTPAEITMDKVFDLISRACFQFGDLNSAIVFTETLLEFEPSNENAKNKLNKYKGYLPTCPSNPKIMVLNSTASNAFEALCMGEVFEKTSKRQRALSCRYSTGGGNPRLMYAPVKEEVLWDEPRIIRYHDVISDREIEILKNLTGPQSFMTEFEEILGTVTHYSASQSVLLPDQYSVVTHVNQRIADITGLVETAEDLYVQNFGIGAGNKAHYDIYDGDGSRMLLRGNTIATFMYYMSDVDIGGTTVFPKVEVALKPKKGSAVFWYNLLQNGQLDLKTEHAECPVLRGNLWVAFKWIHEFGQEFRRPCSLSEWK